MNFKQQHEQFSQSSDTSVPVYTAEISISKPTTHPSWAEKIKDHSRAGVAAGIGYLVDIGDKNKYTERGLFEHFKR